MNVTAPLFNLSNLPADPFGDFTRPEAARNIEATGKQFESLFLSMLLKEMRQTLGPEGLFAGDTGDIHGGLFDMFMGQSLADSGGIGLADVLARQYQVAAPAHAPNNSTLHLSG